MNNTIRITALCALISTQGHAAVSNPASINYVNQAVAAGVAQTTYTAGSGIMITSNQIAFSARILSVGDLYRGGVVFFTQDKGMHGLVISIKNISSTAPFSNNTQLAKANGIGSGLTNTIEIISVDSAKTGQGNSAAALTARHVANSSGFVGGCDVANGSYNPGACFGGWYLPTPAEAQYLFENYTAVNDALSSIGGTQLTSEDYWTSTSTGTPSEAYAYNPETGVVSTYNNSSTTPVTRAIQQF